MRSITFLRPSPDSPCCSGCKKTNAWLCTTSEARAIVDRVAWLIQVGVGDKILRIQNFFSSSRGCASQIMRSRMSLRPSPDSPCCSKYKTLKHDSIQPPRPEVESKSHGGVGDQILQIQFFFQILEAAPAKLWVVERLWGHHLLALVVLNLKH